MKEIKIHRWASSMKFRFKGIRVVGGFFPLSREYFISVEKEAKSAGV